MKFFLQSLFLIAMALVIVLAAGIIPMPSFLVFEKAARGSAPLQSVTQPVTVERALIKNFKQTLRLTGSLVARDEILVSPELSGLRITSITAAEGDYVAKGQVLAQLVDTQLKTLLAQNAAAMAKARAAIAQAKSQIVQGHAGYNEAKAALDRAVILQKKRFTSRAVLDARKAAAQTAEARLISARDGLALAMADKQQIKAQRRELDWKIGNTKIKAPEAGLISRKTAKIGALASGLSEPLFRIIAKGEIELEAEVTESELPQLRVGQSARITLPGQKQVPGTVRLIYPEINKSSRLGRIRIFIGANANLRIGSFAHAIVETSSSKGVGVPLSSILFDDDGARLQIVKNDKVISRRVETGLRADGLIEITAGVDNGDLVVVRAGTFLRDGDAVTPILQRPDTANSKLREAMR